MYDPGKGINFRVCSLRYAVRVNNRQPQVILCAEVLADIIARLEKCYKAGFKCMVI